MHPVKRLRRAGIIGVMSFPASLLGAVSFPAKSLAKPTNMLDVRQPKHLPRPIWPPQYFTSSVSIREPSFTTAKGGLIASISTSRFGHWWDSLLDGVAR